jgi:hypothetical protein
MSDLDDLSYLRQLDTQGWLERATTYDERAAAAARLQQAAQTETGLGHPARAAALALVLPPELMALGEIAAALSTGPHVALYPAAVRAEAPPTPRLYLLSAAIALRARHDPETELAAAATTAVDLAPYVAADHHPAQVLHVLAGLLAAAAGLPRPPVTTPAADLLMRCRPGIPAAGNPAKQMALRLHDRIPCFWGAGLCAAVAADWAMRYLWYAEAMAWAVSEAELSRLLILARLPRYWPNSAVFVRLAPPGEMNAQLAVQMEWILTRRRFPTVELPGNGLSDREHTLWEHALAWLELGEWLALYAAALYNVDPAQRVPLELLFGRP